MKSAEEWSKEIEPRSRSLFKKCMSAGFIRAIQEDARGIARHGALIPLPIAHAAPIDANEQLHLAADQMKVADENCLNPSFRHQHARDNATEHRRIAEAYIALAQAMKP